MIQRMNPIHICFSNRNFDQNKEFCCHLLLFYFSGPVNALKDESNDPIHIDIGLYGYSPKSDYKPQEALRNMEKFTRDHAGYQVIR